MNFFPFQCYDFYNLFVVIGDLRIHLSSVFTYRVTLSYIVRVCFSRKVARVTPLPFLFFDNKTRGIPDLRSGSGGFGMGEGDRGCAPFFRPKLTMYIIFKERE